MALTLTTQPGFPVANKPVTATITATIGNYVKLYATDAPLGSKFRTDLDKSGTTRLLVAQADAGKPITLSFDVGGTYRFIGQEYTKGAAPFGGGFDGDPQGYQSETLIGETEASVNVGTRLTTTIGIAPDTASLVLHVWGDTIRPTTVTLHGEKSPAIIDPATDKAKTATLAAAGAALALANTTASASLGSLAALVDSLIDKINGHLTQSGIHGAHDTDNAIDVGFKNPGTLESLKESTQRIFQALTRHIGNDSGTGIGSGKYHFQDDGVKLADWANMPLKLQTGNLEQVRTTLADLWWSFTQHRQSTGATGVHRAIDLANVTITPGQILIVDKDFLVELKKFTPDTPSTANAGVTTLVHGGGFKQA